MQLSLESLSDKCLASFDNEIDINLKLSINFFFYITAIPLSSSFLIGTEKVKPFSVFSPKIPIHPQILLLALRL